MQPRVIAFTHIDESVYNDRKMKAPYDQRLKGNSWKSPGAESGMPELDSKAMQEAFQLCGEKMSRCVAEVYGSFKHGSSYLDTEIYEYYAIKGGSNRYNPYEFKLPFRSSNLDLNASVDRCRGDVKTILQNAMNVAGNLEFYGSGMAGYILWEAGAVWSGEPLGANTTVVSAQDQVEKVVCRQLTLDQTFAHQQLSQSTDWDGRLRFQRRTTSVQISVGMYFEQIYGRYGPLRDGSVMSSSCNCSFSDPLPTLALSNVITNFTISEDGNVDVPKNPTRNTLAFDPFEGSSVLANHIGQSSEESDSEGTLTLSHSVSTKPPTYQTNESDPAPSYRSRWRRWRA